MYEVWSRFLDRASCCRMSAVAHMYSLHTIFSLLATIRSDVVQYQHRHNSNRLCLGKQPRRAAATVWDEQTVTGIQYNICNSSSSI